MKALNQSKKLFQDLNESGIRYCHWKSNEHLLEGLAGDTDLDVLVDLKQSTQVAAILHRNGYIKLYSQYGSRYPGVEDWLACDEDTTSLIHIHLHFEIITGHTGLKEFDLPWTEKALSTRIMNEDYQVYTADPNLEIILLLTRIGLKSTLSTRIKAATGRYALSEDDIRELKFLNERVDRKTAISFAEPYYGADAEILLDLANSAEFRSEWIQKIMTITNRHLKGYARYGMGSLMILRPYYQLVLFLRRIFRKLFKIRMISKKSFPAGSNISIAIIGQDGAGKSTVIKELKEWLTWKLDVQTYYMGCGDGYHSAIKKMMSFFSEKKAGRPIASFLSVINYIQVARHVKRNFRSARKYANFGSVVLFDRYPQNQYFGINDGPKIRKIIDKHSLPSIIGRIARQAAEYEEKSYALADRFMPSLIIKLVLPPEVSIARKPNETIEDVKKKHQIIIDLPFPESEVLTINAEMDYAQEIKMIRSVVWKKIYETAMQ